MAAATVLDVQCCLSELCWGCFALYIMKYMTQDSGRQSFHCVMQYAWLCAHWAACIFYFIARQNNFTDTTWVGNNPLLFQGKPNIIRWGYTQGAPMSGFAVSCGTDKTSVLP